VQRKDCDLSWNLPGVPEENTEHLGQVAVLRAAIRIAVLLNTKPECPPSDHDVLLPSSITTWSGMFNPVNKSHETRYLF
jgi:hypothetical protein